MFSYRKQREISSSMSSQAWEEVIETHHLPTPDTVGASMTSEKVRIDETTGPDDNLLMVNKRRESSTLDRQPQDFEDLGIYFSPTNEINEDILYTLGSFRLDDFIGNPLPSAQSSSVYEELKDIRIHYTKKLNDQYKFWEYIKMIQNFDHTLFKIIEKFTPARANLKTGLLIEPNFLERNKIARNSFPNRSDGQTMLTGSHQTFEVQITTDYTKTRLYSIATSSNATSITGQYEPGSYVVSYNNLTDVTSSKTSERLEQGTNGIIEIYDEHMDPFRKKKNRFGALHAFNSQPCQAPIKPFVQRISGLAFGIGASAIGSSFVVGEYTSQGGNNVAGVGFSNIGSGFMVDGYTPAGVFSIGSATIGSTFIVDSFTPQPQLNANYKTHESNTLLGNATIGRKSKKYFKYQTYSFRASTYSVENGVETPLFGQTT